MKIFTDRKFRLPRIWSNRELEKFAGLFTGDVVNVSGWVDIDKEGRHYRDYFVNAGSYIITNFKSEARGYQGKENEIFLDLEKSLPEELKGRFDVAFNHTTLEHIYDFKKAFENICLMSRDIVILVVPFLQQMHADYGDFWRFTPMALKRMFEEQGMSVLYLSYNDDKKASVYIFCIASKNSEKWEGKITQYYSHGTEKRTADGFESYIGSSAIPNMFYKLKYKFSRLIGK